MLARGIAIAAHPAVHPGRERHLSPVSVPFSFAAGFASGGGAATGAASAALRFMRGSGLALALTLPGAPLWAEPAPRPADLRIILERTSFRGPETIGVYGRVPEPGQPGQWRVKIWREKLDRLVLDTESIDCRPGHATRIGTDQSRVVVQTLNPGGLITPANRLDHLIWWATCAPEQAGRDPALLAAEARRLGFNGQQQESTMVLPGQAAPHP
jgi:hypothetical protein